MTTKTFNYIIFVSAYWLGLAMVSLGSGYNNKRKQSGNTTHKYAKYRTILNYTM